MLIYFINRFGALLEGRASITLASPKGGQLPNDSKCDAPSSQTPATLRFKADAALQQLLAHTKKLPEVSADDFEGAFYPGGHGPIWDLTRDTGFIKLIEAFPITLYPISQYPLIPISLQNVSTDQ